MAFEPTFIKEFYIYDILFNGNNQIVIISAAEIEAPTIKLQDGREFFLKKCPHKHIYLYILHYPNAPDTINLLINDNLYQNIRINKYPHFNSEILFSTLVKNEDSYIMQWINFHQNLGVKRFIIYDNAPMGLETLLQDYIQKGTVILINWRYTYEYPKSGFSAQVAQQNHSIWAFKLSKYIGLFDVDEYINLQKHSTLEALLNQIPQDKISCFRFYCKLFYNPFNLPTSGYNFLRIFNCDKVTKLGREKSFVLPRNVELYSVHTVTVGLPTLIIDEKIAYFNHYFFLNKTDRGKNNTILTDNSILRFIPQI